MILTSLIQTKTCVLLTAACLLLSCQSVETDRDLFLKADADKDERLSLAEVKAAGLPRLFARFDTDGDGAVTLTEARAVQAEFDEKEFTSRDLNSDGKVTYAEYRQVAEHKTVLIELFEQIDTNRDGFIDRSEAEKYTDSLEKSQS